MKTTIKLATACLVLGSFAAAHAQGGSESGSASAAAKCSTPGKPHLPAGAAGQSAPLRTGACVRTRPRADGQVVVTGGGPATLKTSTTNIDGAWWFVAIGDRVGWVLDNDLDLGGAGAATPPPVAAAPPPVAAAPMPAAAPSPAPSAEASAPASAAAAGGKASARASAKLRGRPTGSGAELQTFSDATPVQPLRSLKNGEGTWWFVAVGDRKGWMLENDLDLGGAPTQASAPAPAESAAASASSAAPAPAETAPPPNSNPYGVPPPTTATAVAEPPPPMPAAPPVPTEPPVATSAPATSAPPNPLVVGSKVSAKTDAKLRGRPTAAGDVLQSFAAPTPVELLRAMQNSEGVWWYVNSGEKKGWLLQSDLQP